MAERPNPRRWVEFVLEPYPTAAATTYRWATRPLAGTPFVEGRISSEDAITITRRASSASGEPHIDSATLVVEDTDGQLRALLAATETQWFENREVAYKLLSDAAYAAGLTPRIRFGGRCYDVQPQDGRKLSMEFEDLLAPYMDRLYPQYTLGDAYPYRFDGRDETVDENLHTEDPGLQIPLALRDQVMPIYYGPHIDSAVDPITGVHRGKGLCPTFFMGYTYLTSGGELLTEPSPELAVIMDPEHPGTDWGGWCEFFVALGEVDVPNVYISDLQESPKRIVAPDDHYGITILAPGRPGWPFPTNYVMRNGFRCTVVYLRGPIAWHHITGLVNVTVDVCGWKNSSGVAIDQAGFAWQSFLSEHVLAHDGAGYTSGPEAGLPLYADGRAKIWTSKVQAWQALTADRLNTAKGYLCSIALTKPMTLREIRRAFNVTFDCFDAKNGAGQLYLFSIDDLADPAAGTPIRERTELRRLPAPKFDRPAIENSIDYTVGYDPEQQTPRTPVLNVKSDSAIAALKETRKPPQVLDLRFTSDDATALDAMGRRLMRLKTPPLYQPLPVGIGGVDREIGEQVLVSHQDGIGPAGVGYLNTPMVLLGSVEQGNEITLEAFDVSRILAAASRWAGDAVPSWDSATEEEQELYGFWSTDQDTVGAANEPAPEWR